FFFFFLWWFFKFIFFILSTLILLLLGARSELLVYVLCIPFFYIINTKKHIQTMLFLLIPIILFIFSTNLSFIIEIIPESRITDLFENKEKATSIIARIRLLNNGMNSILDNPILGDYGSYTLLPGQGIGSYIHNILSAWVNLGILGFMIQVLLLLFLIKGIFDFKNHPSNISKFYISLAFSTILMLIFSKQYLYMHLGFCIGLIANIKSNKSLLKLTGKK
ncbi:O-antigen ligase family protein, partial [Xenorhabdus griffiniae]|uniref:O-antigen ligase family protein n=1 Tax=Xenorhabdus griffiniae TaxID=351672 RepID=UPI0016779006